jgi:hypothetical protein
VVVISQLASGCRAARRRCGGNLPVGSWLPGCPRAAGWPGLVRPSMGPEAPPGAGPVRYVARWFALFRPSPLKTGPSQCTDHPHSKRRFFKVFCTLSHHIHHFGPKWGRRVCREARLGWTDRAGSSRLSHGGVGAQRGPRDAGRHVELRQGLYGRHGVSRGLLCTTPTRAGVVEGLAPGG